MKSCQKHAGFTLSEVLLVLSVIGVVAALTIPTLVQKIGNDQNISKLKKTYSTLAQTFIQLQTDNGGSIIPVFQNDVTTNDGNGTAMNAFATKLNIIKNCGSSLGCLNSNAVYYLDGSTYTTNLDNNWNGKGEKAILADGTMLLLRIASNNCTANRGSGPLSNSVCAKLEVAFAGNNSSNISGRNYFLFWITQTGIYPLGSNGDGFNCSSSPGTSAYSDGCATKVLSESTMSY